MASFLNASPMVRMCTDGNSENDCTNHSAYCDGCMETVYFGTGGGYRPATTAPASAPLIMMDMENGLYACSSKDCSNNTYVPALSSEFVTAMVKGGEHGFAIKGGDATKGSLTTQYDGPRPPGYQPMHKAGAIILGVGGDNSQTDRALRGPPTPPTPPTPTPGWALSRGTFYEGLLTVGYSSDAADSAVQADIIRAGYGSAHLKSDDGGLDPCREATCPEDSVDCTDALQATLNASGCMHVGSRGGSPWPTRPLELRSNTIITFQAGTQIVAKKGEFHDPGDSLFATTDWTTNVTIVGWGSVWRMRRADYADNRTYSHSEWRAGLVLVHSSYVHVVGLTITETGGDGIYIIRSRNLCIDSCIIDRCYRQGISVIAATDMVVTNSTFSQTGRGPNGTIVGTPPMCGGKRSSSLCVFSCPL